jgi:hypothetical protein
MSATDNFSVIGIGGRQPQNQSFVHAVIATPPTGPLDRDIAWERPI